MDGRPRLGRDIRLFNGDSRGRWEGNTLVIEVTNQNAIAWLDLIGNFLSPAADVVERLTMIDHNVIYVTVTVEDPNVFTRPWALAFGLRRNADPDFEMWENACWEGVTSSPSLQDTVLKWYPGFSK